MVKIEFLVKTKPNYKNIYPYVPITRKKIDFDQQPM